MILLESGLLSQCYSTYDVNKPKAISLVLPNRILNYLSFVGIGNNKENIVALRNSIVYKLPIKEAKFHFDSNSKLKSSFQTYCMDCIASDYDGFTCMFTCDTERRLAFLFVSLATSFNCDVNKEWSYIPLKLSYSELSAVMYTTKKTVERIIPRWKMSGYIKVDNNGVYINNRMLISITKD